MGKKCSFCKVLFQWSISLTGTQQERDAPPGAGSLRRGSAGGHNWGQGRGDWSPGERAQPTEAVQRGLSNQSGHRERRNQGSVRQKFMGESVFSSQEDHSMVISHFQCQGRGLGNWLRGDSSWDATVSPGRSPYDLERLRNWRALEYIQVQ